MKCMWAFVGSARREGGYGKVLVSAKQPATTNTHSLGKSVLAKTPEIRTTFPIQYRVNVYFFSFSVLFLVFSLFSHPFVPISLSSHSASSFVSFELLFAVFAIQFLFVILVRLGFFFFLLYFFSLFYW
uniref:Uncharacterized protein n=1 Tax=Cacopsylla melanoneura TaxID=428564 RepID=A0A8D9BRR8_9HEMI